MKKKVLILEDQTKLRESIDAVFKSNGFDVVTATDGVTGMKLAEQELPDAILLDLILPRKDGFEVLDDLKAHPALKDIPVIVLTNLEGENDVRRAKGAGASEYLIKANHSLKEVFDVVMRVLSLDRHAN